MAGVALAAGRMRQFEEDEVDDRAYRIAHNKGQVRLDELSGMGAAAGFFGGLIFMRMPIVGACVGLASGPVLLAAENAGVEFPALPDSAAKAKAEAK